MSAGEIGARIAEMREQQNVGVAQVFSHTEEELLAAFAAIDRNGDGRRNAGELGQALAAAGIVLEPSSVDTMFRKADVDGDGSVDFAEFTAVLAGKSVAWLLLRQQVAPAGHDHRRGGEVHDHRLEAQVDELARHKFPGEVGIFDEVVDAGRQLAARHGITIETCVTEETEEDGGDPETGRKLWSGDSAHYPKPGDTVSVHYAGWVVSCPKTPTAVGTKFDSSRTRGKPLTFVLGRGQVMQGWDEVVPLMSAGQRSMVNIPAAMAYGSQGYPPLVPGGAALLFDIHLVRFFDAVDRIGH
jgi:FK506-binding protein 1